MNQYKKFSQAHALIIAIAEYEINKLPAVVTKDAFDIANLLTSEQYCGYDKSKVVKLIDSVATLANIRNAFNELSNRVNQNDTVFIYFSGHGYNQGSPTDPDCSLVPVDFRTAGLLSENELSSLLSNINSDRLLFVIDACHSGGAAAFKSLSNEPLQLGFSEKSMQKLSQGRGKVLMASSRNSETSLILGGDENSLFTKHLLSALKGSAGSKNEEVIGVFDIFSYLEKNVPIEAAKHREAQHPVFKGNLENNFPVTLRCSGIVKQISEESSIEPIQNNKKLENLIAELYPLGPTDQDIWQRAGGDISRLKFNGNGRSQWFSAFKILSQGGGGSDISTNKLINEVKLDFPNNPSLNNFDQIPNLSKLNQVEDISKQKVVSINSNRVCDVKNRLNILLTEINQIPSNSSLTPSKIAAKLGYEYASEMQSWFEGEAEPSFGQLRQLAQFFGCDEDWLLNGTGQPFSSKSYQGFREIFNLLDFFTTPDEGYDKVIEIVFIRKDSKEGEIIIGKIFDSYRYKLYRTPFHLSHVVGATGAHDRAVLILMLEAFYHSLWKMKVRSYLVDSTTYDALISGQKNALRILPNHLISPWMDDIWDREMYLKNSDNLYWKGWKDLCLNIASDIEMDKSMKEDKEMIKNGNHKVMEMLNKRFYQNFD